MRVAHERTLRSKIPDRIRARARVQHIIAAFCREAAIAAAFAYCGWFALGEPGALILATMVFMVLAWRPADGDVPNTRRIRISRDE
jgi:hypothetical protein